MSPAAYFSKNPDHISRIVDNQVIVVLLKDERDTSDRFFVFNETGSFVWNILDKHKKAEDISDVASREFDVIKETAAKEILEFLNDLVKKRLVSCSK